MLRVTLPVFAKRFRWLPYRMTLKGHPILYRWLWFNWTWGPGWSRGDWGSDECDECDGSGTYYLDGEPQKCICSESQVPSFFPGHCRCCNAKLADTEAADRGTCAACEAVVNRAMERFRGKLQAGRMHTYLKELTSKLGGLCLDDECADYDSEHPFHLNGAITSLLDRAEKAKTLAEKRGEALTDVADTASSYLTRLNLGGGHKVALVEHIEQVARAALHSGEATTDGTPSEAKANPLVPGLKVALRVLRTMYDARQEYEPTLVDALDSIIDQARLLGVEEDLLSNASADQSQLRELPRRVPPDERLTQAVILLGQARDQVADYVDDSSDQPKPEGE